MLLMMSRRALALVTGIAAAAAAGCGGGAPRPARAPSPPPTHIDAPNQILGAHVEGTAKELRDAGEHALLAQKWREAVDAFEALVAGDPASANDPQVLYELGLAYEGLGEREKARDRFREVAKRFATDPTARLALAREVSLDAYLEDWPALGEVGDALLARTDLEPADRMLGLGARAMSRVERGDEGAMHDVQTGLDLVDEYHYGATGQLPVAAAMLHFALGEVKKLASEKISLNPPGPDFVLKLETRCAYLLQAQSAFADAIRSVDPHWAAMSGYRVGEMYRTLHHDLMLIPPTEKAKTESDKQLFYGIMHVRYRVLLEKGVEMMNRTLAFGQKTGEASAWMKRAEAAKAEMEKALEDEKAQLATYPFTEEELQKALEIMKRNAQKEADKKAAAKPR
jgi:tetratricopeptide (TPR) repeat protein